MRIWSVSFFLLALMLAVAGCTTKSAARAQAQAAFMAGQRQGAQNSEAVAPIQFVGDVRNAVIPWSEGLTLAQGIVLADYTGLGTPHRIYVTRGVQRYEIDPKDLLSGAQNPLLEPGDRVEISRF